MLNLKNINSIADYFNLCKKLDNAEITYDKTAKIAVLSSFTTKGLKEVIKVECAKNEINADFYIGEYNQYIQEILNINSGLYNFEPEIVFILPDTRSLLADNYFFFDSLKEDDKKDLILTKFKEITGLVEKLKQNMSEKIILNNFEVPMYSALGILENKQKYGIVRAIKDLNQRLEDYFCDDSQTFIFDFDGFCSKFGKNKIIDYKMYYLADIKICLDCLPQLAQEYLAYIIPLKAMSRKCIVLDLDNTLWGGIVGEDDFDGIKLGPSTEGRPFWEFQKYLLSLNQRGVILAINSKNNYEEAMKVIKEHPYMILRESNFASIQINWNDKASNLKTIAKEINIGTDTLVFIDDDKINREIVKSALPDVLTVELPEDSSLYCDMLHALKCFNTFQLTEEDTKKGIMYSAQKKRNELFEDSINIDSYLKELETVVTIESLNDFNLPRIAQLCQKTNQFNMTTKRYTEKDIINLKNNGNHAVYAVSAQDKLGDNGLVGVIIIEKHCKEWIIDSFILSCRVIGRNIEQALFSYILEKAKIDNVQKLKGIFIPTSKNIPAQNFYASCEFIKEESLENKQIWNYNTEKNFDKLKYIDIKEN